MSWLSLSAKDALQTCSEIVPALRYAVRGSGTDMRTAVHSGQTTLYPLSDGTKRTSFMVLPFDLSRYHRSDYKPMKMYKVLIPMLLSASLHAQAWVKVANENDTIVTPTAISVRYGSGSSWVTATETGTFSASNSTFGDPVPGTAKELDVLETATPQTMTVNGTSVTVPASTQTATSAPTTTATTYPIPIPALTAPLPAVVDPGMSCPIVGKAAKCPARTLLNAGQTTTAPSTTSIPAKWNISCPVALVNGVPDLTQPLQCTITAAK